MMPPEHTRSPVAEPTSEFAADTSPSIPASASIHVAAPVPLPPPQSGLHTTKSPLSNTWMLVLPRPADWLPVNVPILAPLPSYRCTAPIRYGVPGGVKSGSPTTKFPFGRVTTLVPNADEPSGPSNAIDCARVPGDASASAMPMTRTAGAFFM